MKAPGPSTDTVGECYGCIINLKPDGETIGLELALDNARVAPARFGLDGSLRQCAALKSDGNCAIGRISNEAANALIQCGITDLASVPKPCLRTP